MDRIALLGVSYRRDGASALARFTAPAADRPALLRRLAAALETGELVYLATCNRVELIFVTDGRTPLGEYRARAFRELTGETPDAGVADRSFRAWTGEGAAEHLFLVTAGLDSARLGESEIAGQAHRAFECSRELGLVGPRLEMLFTEAFRVAARVRRKTRVSSGHTSLADIALGHVVRHLASPGAPAAQSPVVALLGVSAMTSRCGHALLDCGARLVVASRTLEHAEELGRELAAQAVTFEAFRAAPPAVEAAILAVGAQEPVLSRADLERLAARSASGRAPLVVDLGMPPNVLAADAAAAAVPYVGLEEVLAEAERDRAGRIAEVADAREIVDRALTDLRQKMIDRALSPLFAAVQRRYRETAIEGVERLFRKQLAGLGDEQRDAVRVWAETLARRFAHLPTEGLRGLAYEAGTGAVESFLAQADESMVRALHEATSRPEAPRLRDAEEI